jgi:hypothetical protein
MMLIIPIDPVCESFCLSLNKKNAFLSRVEKSEGWVIKALEDYLFLRSIYADDKDARNILANKYKYSKDEDIELLALGCQRLNIKYPERFNMCILQDIIKMSDLSNFDNPQETPPAAVKKLAFVAVNRADYNGAFQEDQEDIEKLIENGYRVVYREIETEEQLTDYIKEFTNRGLTVDYWEIAGHGDGYGIQLSDGRGDKYKIDWGDQELFE